jgi:CHAT domain-containing protein
MQNAGKAKYLHVAAHGIERRDNPMYSAIKLADSELRLIDLDRLRLSADLVTLSGCSTGLSVVTGGDELLGLMRGMLTAGARTLLAALWDVGDEATANFMTAFYVNLFRQTDQSPARALRATILEMMENKDDIYSWAAFQVVGVG